MFRKPGAGDVDGGNAPRPDATGRPESPRPRAVGRRALLGQHERDIARVIAVFFAARALDMNRVGHGERRTPPRPRLRSTTAAQRQRRVQSGVMYVEGIDGYPPLVLSAGTGGVGLARPADPAPRSCLRLRHIHGIAQAAPFSPHLGFRRGSCSTKAPSASGRSLNPPCSCRPQAVATTFDDCPG